jgi:hypothetical protein
MRQGQQNKRMRGRNHRKGPNPLTRSYESNGGDVKIRGTALHIAEKYVQLARDAQSSGDRVAAENYFQHAEHYYRLVAAAQAQMPQPQPFVRNDEEIDDEDERFEREGEFGGDRAPYQGGQGGGQPNYGAPESQPYVNGNGQSMPDAEAPRGQPNQEGQQPRFDNRENRGQGGQGEQRERGDFRGRRRRPFRERYSDQGQSPRAEAPDGGGAPEAPAGED